MPFYPAALPDVMPSRAEGCPAGLPACWRSGPRTWRGRPGRGEPAARRWLPRAWGKIATGDLVVFFKPVVIAPAVARRDGRVQAAGHPAEHARLGVAGDRLDALDGQPGVTGQIAAGLRLDGKSEGTCVAG